MVKFSLISRSRNGRMMNSFRNLPTCPGKHRGNVWKHLLTGIKTSSLQSTWYLKGKLVFFLWNKRDEPVGNGRVWSSGLFITSAAQSIPGSFHEVSALLASLTLGASDVCKGHFCSSLQPHGGQCPCPSAAPKLLPGSWWHCYFILYSILTGGWDVWQEGQPGGLSPFSQVTRVRCGGREPARGSLAVLPWRAAPKAQPCR